MLLEHFSVFFQKHRAAASGQNNVLITSELIHKCAFTLAEPGLALDLENDMDRDTGTFFNLVIDVDKPLVQQRCQVPANGSLASTHRTDKENIIVLTHSVRMPFQGTKIKSATPG